MEIRTIEIACDDCGDSVTGVYGDTAADIRRELREQGWRYRDGDDYCPKCIAGDAS